MRGPVVVVCVALAGAVALSPARTHDVATLSQLHEFCADANSGDTLLLADGTYTFDGPATVVVRVEGLCIRSKSGNRDKVVIRGVGMHASMHNGFRVNADNVTFADLTIENVRNHCIQTDVDVDGLRVINCVLRDAGEQMLKVPRGNSSNTSDNGRVEGCLFEYSAGIGPRYYIGGIDAHYCKDWVVRHNTFKSIRSPEKTVAEHAVHFWDDAEGTLVDGNTIIDCDRGIGFGLGTRGHAGGLICNNMLYHANLGGSDRADVGISLESSPGTRVCNNTIYFDNSYPNAIEYRFDATRNVSIINNLSNRAITARDGASATVSSNVTNAAGSWFVDPSAGDLHLGDGSVSSVVDRGETIDDVAHDFDGESRPQGTRFDIGADEYQNNPVGLERGNARISGTDASRYLPAYSRRIDGIAPGAGSTGTQGYRFDLQGRSRRGTTRVPYRHAGGVYLYKPLEKTP